MQRRIFFFFFFFFFFLNQYESDINFENYFVETVLFLFSFKSSLNSEKKEKGRSETKIQGSLRDKHALRVSYYVIN